MMDAINKLKEMVSATVSEAALVKLILENHDKEFVEEYKQGYVAGYKQAVLDYAAAKEKMKEINE